VPQDTLDFTSFTMNLGSKLVLDCTSPAGGISGDEAPQEDAGAGFAELPGGIDAPFGSPAERDDRVIDWRGYRDALLVARVRERDGRTGRAVAETLAASADLGGYKWVAVVSDDVPLDDRTLLLWGIFTRFDAARDVIFSRARLEGAWPRYSGRMAIDATWKPGYPDPIVMDPEIVRKVDARWGEYGLADR
jgi:4-hydroxy-3-polyprenylbenzoate decarboxylase